ncbi:MAG: tyrosine-type recombinase/integrase [Deltaproteobacteria bacterium]|nr:tyrosine-type recombinase/integrase [Deltaproteobacteria bacterium]
MPWHSLRHAFCSELARAGVPVHVIQKLAGHKSIETTLRYMHVDRDDKRAAIDVLRGSVVAPTASKAN